MTAPVCLVCGEGPFRSTTERKQHMKTHPRETRRFECPECGRVMGSYSARLKHIGAHRGILERFMAQVEITDDCWNWTGCLVKTTEGYGQLKVLGKHWVAHRFAYEHFVGPIPDGLEVDHLCRNRGCVNPEHLEPVTRDENMRRAFEAQKAVGAPCLECAFVATIPGALASHVRHKHAEVPA